nr:thiophen and furan oxidation protein [Cavernulicola chilensis]
MNDTITAITTAVAAGQGSVAIIRISGEEAVLIAKTIIYKSYIKNWQSHRILYGWVKNPYTDQFIDEVLVLVMLAPRSYTREDIIEIQCHGGIIIAQKILDLIVYKGARIAKPGEFTLRAFLNGRLDLSQAESIIAIVNAKSSKSAYLAMSNLRGKATKDIVYLKSQCLEILSEVEFQIDFEEEEFTNKTINIQNKISNLFQQVRKMLTEVSSNILINRGINICILGKPNVGKSSLLNTILDYEKSIVTDISGTTRDIIEAEFLLGGIPIKLIDTAGLQNTNNLVEQIGIVKTQSVAQEADLILLVIDIEKDWGNEEEEILTKLRELPIIIIINKVDLNSDKIRDINSKIPHNYLSNVDKVIFTSTIDYSGIDHLKSSIVQVINEKILVGQSSDKLSLNERQTYNLINTKKSLKKALYTIDQGYPCDLWTIDLRKAINNLEEITGDRVTELVLDNIFSKFCIGK